MRGIVGVTDLYDFDYHICPCESYFWPSMALKDYRAPGGIDTEGNREYQCPKCLEYRVMEIRRPNGHIDLCPQQVCVGSPDMHTCQDSLAHARAAGTKLEPPPSTLSYPPAAVLLLWVEGGLLESRLRLA